MRIAIDARLLEARDIGSAVYARAVLGALGRTPDRHEYLLICRPGARAVLGFAPQFEWVELEEARLMDERWEQLALPELLAGAEADVYFSLTSVLPAIKTSPQVTIIHDVGFEEEPGFYESSLRRYLSTWLRAAAQQADYVITVSEHSKAAISRVYGVPDDRILVAHPAPDHIFQPIQEQSRKAVLDLYGLQEPYLLSVAVLEPNKNVKAILEGYQIAGGRAGLQRPLALVGAPGRAAPQLHRAIERLGLGEEVRILGYVPREHLPAIFSGASCFLWASLYEGFGLPPLEAMACGTPVISSNRTAMPEVLGEAAILMDPTRPEQIAEELRGLVEDRELALRLRQAGLVRAAAFSWKRTAEATLACLAEAARDRE